MLILVALCLGALAGILLQDKTEIADLYIKPLGTVFLNLVKMVVVPVVLFSIIQGVISLQDIKKIGTIGGKTVAFYLCTTAFAVTMGLVLANIVVPLSEANMLQIIVIALFIGFGIILAGEKGKLAGVDRILDMARTTVNITGDAACSICVDASEKRKEARQSSI